MSEEVMRHVCSINGLGEISLEIPKLDFADAAHISETVMRPLVKASAEALKDRARARAPKKTGTLEQGIIVNPITERTSNPHKTVYDIVFDAEMNDAFVKITKDGKRYYYPASQEYGFRAANGNRVPGRYYMRDASVEFAAEHRDRVADGVDKILEEL